MTNHQKGITEWRVVTCHICDKHIDKEEDGFATRLVEDKGRTFRLYYCSGCVIMGKYP